MKHVNNTFRKVIACCLATIMCLALCLVTYAAPIEPAATGATLSFSEETINASPGDEITASLEISGNPGFASAGIDLKYDTRILQPISYTTGSATSGLLGTVNLNYVDTEADPSTIDENEGTVRAVFAGIGNAMANGPLVNVVFQVLDYGSTDVSISIDKFRNENLEDIDLTLKTLKVNVAAQTVTINYVALNGGSVTSTSETISENAEIASGSTAIPDTGYDFVGWIDETGATVSNEDTFVPQKDNENKYVNSTYTAQFAPKILNVTWTNYDDSILESGTTQYGTKPAYTSDTPTRTATESTTYEFVGWEPEITEITEDTVYKAIFQESPKTFTVVWKNWDNSILETDESVPYGETPSYDGETPTRDAEGNITYTFHGWSPEITSVTGNAEYTATFDNQEKGYTIRWLNEDETVLETDENVKAGETPEYNGETPSKESDEKNDYQFAGWTPDIEEVSKDTDYTAKFEAVPKTFTVIWKDEDGTVLETDTEVQYGETPSYNGTTPTKEASDSETFVFVGWSPEITAVTGNVTYTAMFSSDAKTYTIKWVNHDGTVLDSGEFKYGDTPVYYGSEPTKQATAEASYAFVGWTPSVSTVTGDMSYTATFSTVAKTYTVHWLNEDGTELETDYEVSYGTVPTYDGSTPSKTGEEGVNYVFAGWTPDVTAVTEEAWYKAQFDTEQETYQITWQDDVGNILISELYYYGETPTYKGETPYKANTDEHSYTFTGWTPTVSTVNGDKTYVATFTETKNQYSVTWMNTDGSVLSSEIYNYGDTPSYKGSTPAINDTESASYTFAGWSPEVKSVTSNATYTATYKTEEKTYTITWLNWDGSVLRTDSGCKYNDSITEYTPVLTRESTDEFNYTFTGWDKPIASTVTGDVTYTAVFSETKRNYTVTWKDMNGTVLETDENVPYGTVPTYDGEEPSQPDQNHCRYDFLGWEPEVKAITGDTEYVAQYGAVDLPYSVTFKNDDGTILAEYDVFGAHTPIYQGEEPTKEGTREYNYVFVGWNPEIAPIDDDTEYVAVFEKEYNTFSVVYKNDDGTVLVTKTLQYGSDPSYTGETPVKESDAQYSYTFSGWDKEIPSEITENLEFTAVYDKTVREYTVTWVNDNGDTLQTDKNVSYGTTPEYSGNEPVKAETNAYTYQFSGWTPSVQKVSGNVVYKATFKKIPKTFTVTWLNYDNTVLETDENVEYNSTPEYNGKTPEKPSTDEFEYKFTRWNPESSAVTGNVTYTAQFAEGKRSYTVTWVNADGTVLKEEPVLYGDTPSFEGTPSMQDTETVSYAFKNWTPDITAVTGDVTYQATYTETSIKQPEKEIETPVEEEPTSEEHGEEPTSPTVPTQPEQPEKPTASTDNGDGNTKPTAPSQDTNPTQPQSELPTRNVTQPDGNTNSSSASGTNGNIGINPNTGKTGNMVDVSGSGANAPNPNAGKEGKMETATTGDTNNIIMWIAIACAAISIITASATVVTKRKRNAKSTNN